MIRKLSNRTSESELALNRWHKFGANMTQVKLRSALFGTGAVLTLLLSACGGGSSGGGGDSSAGVSQADRSAVLVYGGNQIESLDPINLTSACETTALFNVYDSLTRQQPDGRIVPSLATSWEAVDGKFRLHLRENVKFQDGTAFDAEAVKFNIDRTLHDKASTIKADLWQVKDAVVVDAKTVDLVLDPNLPGALPAILSTRAGMMVSPSAVKAAGGDSAAFSKNPIGAGMFKVVPGWTPRGSLQIRAWDGYWDTDHRLLGGVDFKSIQPDAVSGALMAGDIDMAPISIPDMDKVTRASGLTVDKVQTTGMRMLIINETIKPFDDIRVRQALFYAIDRQALAKALTGGVAEAAFSYFPKEHWANAPKVEKLYDYNPDKARDLLKEAGYPDGVTFKAHIGQDATDYIRMGEAIKDMIKKAGFTMDLWFSGPGQSSKLLYFDGPSGHGTSAASPLGMGTSVDPDALFRSRILGNGKYNAGGNELPGVRKLLDEALTTTDEKKRAAIYQDVQMKSFQDGDDGVPLWFTPEIMGFKSNIHGYQAQYHCDQQFRGVYITK